MNLINIYREKHKTPLAKAIKYIRSKSSKGNSKQLCISLLIKFKSNNFYVHKNCDNQTNMCLKNVTLFIKNLK